MKSAAAIDRREGIVLGIDVGGTKIAAGLVRFPGGKLDQIYEIQTLTARGGAGVLDEVQKLAHGILSESKFAPETFFGVGIGICELVDREGNIRSAHCLPWEAREVREKLGRFGPVLIEADVRAAARAEAMFGAGVGAKTFLYVTVGTGISSCLVIEGEPFAGARGASGTMASGPMPGIGPGAGPSLESIASGPGLVASYKAAGGGEVSAHFVVAKAEAGDEEAIEVVRRGGRALGSTIGLLINVLDPDLVVLGGGLGMRTGMYREAVVEAARRHIWWEGHRAVEIVSAATGVAAGVIGAAAGVWMRGRWT